MMLWMGNIKTPMNTTFIQQRNINDKVQRRKKMDLLLYLTYIIIKYEINVRFILTNFLPMYVVE